MGQGLTSERDRSRSPRTALMQARVVLINFLGFTGIVLIVYGIAVYFTGEKYKYLEEAAEGISNIATLFGVALMAASVWLPTNTRDPEDFSLYISAPLVVTGAALVLIFYLFPGALVWLASMFGIDGGSRIPPQIFSGLALLGLAGGLFRTVSR